MDTDEKNKFSSIINEFDPDFTREKDKYDIAKEDRKFQRDHHHPMDLHPDRSKLNEHDPYNTKLNLDPDRKNKKLNTFTDMDKWDINIEESPTNKQLHREHEHGRHQRHDVDTSPKNMANLDYERSRNVVNPQFKTEKLYEKMNEDPHVQSNYLHNK